MPFIQSSYPVRPEEKALAGSSFGGLFALYTLFHHLDTFNRHNIGGPSVGWDEGVKFVCESNWAASKAGLQAKVFVSVGALENEDIIANLQR
jgi:predicted alpha/beta superfamily hydrolase